MEVRTRIILRDKGNVSGAQYAAVEWIHALGRQLTMFMQDYDLILTKLIRRYREQARSRRDVYEHSVQMNTISYGMPMRSRMTRGTSGEMPLAGSPLSWLA